MSFLKKTLRSQSLLFRAVDNLIDPEAKNRDRQRKLLKNSVLSMKDSFVDNVIRETVSKPKVGSLVYCTLTNFEHTGIYIGYGKIVHLDGSGIIEKVSAQEFLDRLGGLNNAISIYTACLDKKPVGSREAADVAKSMIGKSVDYNVFKNNCHLFSLSCLKNDFNLKHSAKDMVLKGGFFKLLDEAEEILGANTWRVWDSSSY